MIIERITAISTIPPKETVKQVAVGRISHTVVTTHIASTGRRLVSDGASGATLDESYEDIDVGSYTQKDQVLYDQQTQITHR